MRVGGGISIGKSDTKAGLLLRRMRLYHCCCSAAVVEGKPGYAACRKERKKELTESLK